MDKEKTKVYVTMDKDDPQKADIIIVNNKKAKPMRSVTEAINHLYKLGLSDDEVESEVFNIDDILRALTEFRTNNAPENDSSP